MKPPKFSYACPASIDEALSLLAQADEEVKVLAGGQSFVPLLNLRMTDIDALVDLNQIQELSYIEHENGTLRIGAMTSHRHIETSDTARNAHSLLVRAAGEVGHLAIRNRGTIGGSIVHADPAAEWPLVAVALDAELLLRTTSGQRSVAARDFFVAPLTTVIEPQELLCEVRFPSAPQGSSWGFQELCRRPGDFAIAAVACQLVMDGSGHCSDASIAVGGAHSTPLAIPQAAAVLLGARLDDSAIVAAAEQASAAVDPPSDVHASADYRRRMVKVLTTRALQEARDKVAH